MAGRPGRAKKNASQQTQTISTQTSPDRYAVDLDLLRKEMRQLKLEIRILKEKDQPDSGGNRDKLEEKTVQKTVEKTVVAQADSPQALKVPAKGCSCKGKCNKKACGCVKKQTACTELCKCSHSRCENQEPDKENEAAPKPRAKKTSDKNNTPHRLDAVTLRKNNQEDGAAGPSNKRVEEVKNKKPVKSLFSPDTSGIHEYRSAKEFDTNETLTFGAIKKQVQFDSDRSDNSPQGNRKKLQQKADKARVEFDSDASDDSSEGKKNHRLKQKVVKTRVEAEVSPLNPMKPTRQLLRTPPSRSTSLSSSLNRSEVQQPVAVRGPSPLPMLFKVRHQSPAGVDEQQIDWDEHYRQLVPCKLCKRTFNPDRIEKHESNCKKV